MYTSYQALGQKMKAREKFCLKVYILNNNEFEIVLSNQHCERIGKDPIEKSGALTANIPLDPALKLLLVKYPIQFYGPQSPL